MTMSAYKFLRTLLVLSSLLSTMSHCKDHHSSCRSTYIVHTDSTLMPHEFSNSHSHLWHRSFMEQITSAGSSTTTTPKLLYSYDLVIDGFCARLSKSELKRIQEVRGFVSYTKSATLKPQTTRTADFIGLSTDHGLWPVSSYGKDVIIGLVDTGIWPESLSYNDAGIGPIPSKWKGGCASAGEDFDESLCNNKLIGAKFFNKAYISNNRSKKTLINSTRDSDGHGTHTSSTAAGSPVSDASYFGYAQGTARGAAPMARLAIYKVVWDNAAESCDVIAAIDEAVKDGVDIISLSIGFPDSYLLYQDPISISTFAATERGVFVSAAAGNDGPRLASVENTAPWILTVAAGTLDRAFHGYLILGNGELISGQSLYPTNLSSSLKMLPIIYMGLCDDVQELRKVHDKMVVCEAIHGNDSFIYLSQQSGNVYVAKVAAAVFICDFTYADESLMPFIEFPYTFVDFKQGHALKKYINKQSATAKAEILFHNTTLGLGYKPAPMVADFSSRGPYKRYTNVLKPDLMAPEYRILASWPENVPTTTPLLGMKPRYGKFNLLSGTSMSTPIAAGVAALLVEAHPDWSPAAIRSALMTTADILDNTGSTISEQDGNDTASPLAMGAGHLNPNKALHPGLIYDAGREDYLTYLCNLNLTIEQIQTITRRHRCPPNIPLSFQLNYPSFLAYFSETGAGVQKMFRTVTNAEDSAAVYHASVTPIDEFEIRIEPEQLTFSAKNEKQEFEMIISRRSAGVAAAKDFIKFGYLTWVDSSGKHTVRSPIVLTGLTLN